MLRAVLDPGVLISAAISPRGAPALLLSEWLEGSYELVVSPSLLAELRQVLLRPKFRSYISLEDVDRYMEVLERLALLVRDPANLPGVTPDPGDDYLVALSRSASADVLVSGDAHLVLLEEAEPPVVSPRDFLERLAPSV
jgi:putative PIN family toxin of toxin-antitoxin system